MAQRLEQALLDPTIGLPVVAHLSEAFVSEFKAQIAHLAKLGTDRNEASGATGILLQERDVILSEFILQASALRRVARHAFTGQGVVLRSEFLIGRSAPRNLAMILDQGRTLLAAVRHYPTELSAFGWSSTATEAFERTVESVAALCRERDNAGIEKLDFTAERTAAANLLYRQCIAVQNVARFAHARQLAAKDVQSVAIQSHFLLDQFPRRFTGSSAREDLPSPTVAPTADPAPVETRV
ncbi:hypothetical protein [Horticoccus sp. 23ND18S-11]|uniref:hypothetical protein n=1 Tax=Horticoccus sp. 23ND18S-11 TaxID=3391832 RepID=UPI0039C975F7